MNKRYNSHYKTYIYLNEGEEFCRKCDGKGRIFDKRRYFSNVKIVKSLICSTCLGTGKLDWIEKVVGKNNNHKVSEHR
jgi:DnaJ-class molecular chaperone